MPCLLFFWSLFNLVLLCGTYPLSEHWGYWQNWLDIFNESNPSGQVIRSELNLRIILIVLGFSCVVAIKRFLIGFQQGRKLFAYYAEDLARVMKKLLLVSQVAALAVQLERERIMAGDNHKTPTLRASRAEIDEVARAGINEAIEEGAVDDQDESKSELSEARSETKLISEKCHEGSPEILSQAQKQRIERLLGNWEEPEAASTGINVRFRGQVHASSVEPV